MHNWVVRTDFEHLDEVILPSLEEGELRQGWGYQKEQDLTVIGPLFYEAGRDALSVDQKATWRRVQRFWPEHWDPVREGDRILLPKVPALGRWRLVEVAGAYRFDPHPLTSDHGHILPVRTIVGDIANTNVAVGAGLQRTMRNRSPMWKIDHLADELDRLVAAADSAAEAHGPTERLKGLLDEVLGDLLVKLRAGFQANQLEEPVARLLRQMFPDAEVDQTAGRGEHGADFVIHQSDPFGHTRTTVVQLKDHPVLDDVRALEQVKEAFEWYAPVAAAVIATTASSEDPEFGTARERLAEELGVPVTAVLGEELSAWFFSHLEAVAAD